MGKEGDWSSTYEEYRFFQSIVAAVICSVALAFDTIMHWLRGRLFRSHHGEPLPTDISTFFGRLFNRMSMELMVLGFVAFCVWVINRSGGFSAIVSWLPDGPEPCAHVEYSELASSSAAPPPPSAPPGAGAALHHRLLLSWAGRQLAAAAPACVMSEGDDGSRLRRKPFHYPPDGYALLHVVEDVHMQIFISMLLYFFLMAIYIAYVRTACERHTRWEREPNAKGEVSRWQRLQLPLSDPRRFDNVKWYFIHWVNALQLSRRPVADLMSPGCCSRADADPSAHSLAGQQPLDERFPFADYLAICLSTQLEELVDFKWQTWLTVIGVALLEAACLYLGAEDMAVDAFFESATLLALGAMWVVAYDRRQAAIRVAADARIYGSADDGHTVTPNHGGVYFVRLLQALMWRCIFWTAVFFLNPQFRQWVKDEHHFKDEHGQWRVVVVVCTFCTAVLLPYVTFNWAFCTNLPPYVNRFTGLALEQIQRQQAAERLAERRATDAPGEQPFHDAPPVSANDLH